MSYDFVGASVDGQAVGIGDMNNPFVLVFPTFGSALGFGAQDVYFEPDGAYTGEISAAMLVDLGCRYVILGHSERRHILGETDATVNRKVHAALRAGLTPIVCVGELLSEREAGQTQAVIARQFAGSLE